MSNEEGYSWTESILAFVIVVVIFGTLLPLYSTMSAQLDRKKKQMHASEAVYHAAIHYQTYGMTYGKLLIEKVAFNWQVIDDSICVSYDYMHEEYMKCIDV